MGAYWRGEAVCCVLLSGELVVLLLCSSKVLNFVVFCKRKGGMVSFCSLLQLGEGVMVSSTMGCRLGSGLVWSHLEGGICR